MRVARRKVFKCANKQAIIWLVNFFKLKRPGMSMPGILEQPQCGGLSTSRTKVAVHSSHASVSYSCKRLFHVCHVSNIFKMVDIYLFLQSSASTLFFHRWEDEFFVAGRFNHNTYVLRGIQCDVVDTSSRSSNNGKCWMMWLLRTFDSL